MSKLLLVAALAVLTTAPAWGQSADSPNYYDYPVNSPATFPDVTLKQECEAFLAPQITYEDTVVATGCQRTVVDYFIDKGIFPKEAFSATTDDPKLDRAAECAVRLILNHITEPKTAADILGAEFEKACNSHATM